MSQHDKRLGTRAVTRRRAVKTIAAGSVAGLAGCAGNGGTGGNTTGTTKSGQQQTIRYLTDRGGAKEFIEKIASDFEDEFPQYTIDVTITPKGKSTDQELQQSIAAGNPYDVIFQASVNAVPQLLEGSLAPVTGTVEETGIPDVLPSDGESYFAPIVITGPNMGWYRTDLYDSHPVTWDEWLTQAKRISEETGTEGFLIKSGRTNNAEGTITNLLWKNDVQIYQGEPGNIEVALDKGENRKKSIEVFQFVNDMNQYSPNGNGMSWGEGVEALQTGSVAADLNLGGLPIATIAGNRPDLIENLAPTIYPLPEEGSPEKILVYMEGHYVRNDGNNVKGAQEFVNYFQTYDELLDFILSEASLQFPPSEDLVNSSKMEQAEFHQKYPETLEYVRQNWDALISIVNTGKGGTPNPLGGLQFSADWGGGAVEQLTVGGKSPEEAVDWLGEKLRGMRD